MLTVDHDLSVYASDSFYSGESRAMMRRYVELICKYSKSRDHFLELGVGHGYTLQYLTQRFSSLSVIDADEKLIAVNKKQHPHVEFIFDYFESYDSHGLRFKNIGMGFVLDIVKEPLQVLKKFSQILDEDGKIYVSIGNAASLHRLIAFNGGLIDDIRFLSPTNKGFGHKRFNTFKDWVDLIECANLRIIASHGLLLKPLTTKQLSQLDLPGSILGSLVTTAYDLPEISNACFFVLENR